MASTSSASVSVPVNADAFGFIRDLLHRESKICIEEDQDYLVDTRLAPIAQEQGVSSVNELVDILRRQPTTSLIASIVDALTTNETSFFRDKPFFETLEQVVFPFIRDTYNELGRASMWCAASSSGQEIYSILMLMQEKLSDVPLESVRFLATDLSPTMIERVRDGSYSQHEVSRGLPTRYLTKYFKRQGMRWQVTDELRGFVETSVLNLHEPWHMIPNCHVLLLRNVLIYFEPDVRMDLINRAHEQLAERGFLFLGSAEPVLTQIPGLERIESERCVGFRRTDVP